MPRNKRRQNPPINLFLGQENQGNNRFAQKKRDRKNKAANAGGPWKHRKSRYLEVIRENPTFEAYYKRQNIVPPEEWDLFMKTMKEDLPTAFRVTGSKAEAKSLLSVVEGQFFKDLLNVDVEDSAEESVKPVCLPWYPNRLGWQLTLTRKAIRSSEAYLKLHNFLITETNCGSISRQETVSMIPPILMDIKPHHKVLDMCAAPGSKTAQIIEMLHAEDSEIGKIPEGLVVANDVDNSRCYMLVHQAKRLNSPCITIINHDAGALPNMFVTNADGSKSVLKFDRILCDVPCSGDGTLRKNPDIWAKWNAANGNNMHGIQTRVARRGLEMLTLGGRMVYSTCSLNPVEDEAVVSRLLKSSKGAVRLVDVSASVPGLVYSKGVTKWSPCSRDFVHYEKYQEVPEKFHTQIRPFLFPLPEEELKEQHLDRCIRILPHHQNTGGFFVAVLEKVKLLPWETQKASTSSESQKTSTSSESQKTSTSSEAQKTSTSSEAQKTSTTSEAPENPDSGENGEAGTSESGKGDAACKSPPRKRRRVIQGYREDPFVFFTEEEELWPHIRDMYDIRPELSPTCFLTRCKRGKKKNIYMTSPAVRDLILNNQDSIRLINTGIKTFARCDNKKDGCPFRLSQEGLQSILNFLGPKRRVEMNRDDFVVLLKNDHPRFPSEIKNFSKPVQERLNSLETQGSLVVELKDDELPLTVVAWKGSCSVRPYVSIPECAHMLRLLGEDVSKFEVNKFKDKALKEGTEDEAKEKNGGEVEEKVKREEDEGAKVGDDKSEVKVKPGGGEGAKDGDDKPAEVKVKLEEGEGAMDCDDKSAELKIKPEEGEGAMDGGDKSEVKVKPGGGEGAMDGDDKSEVKVKLGGGEGAMDCDDKSAEVKVKPEEGEGAMDGGDKSEVKVKPGGGEGAMDGDDKSDVKVKPEDEVKPEALEGGEEAVEGVQEKMETEG